MWEYSHRADPYARALADRHYNRQSIGAKHFAPPWEVRRARDS